MTKIRAEKVPLGKKIIDFVIAGGIVSLASIVTDLCYMSTRDKSIYGWRVKRSLNNLERNDLVRIKEVNGEEYLEITDKGKLLKRQSDLDKISISEPLKWDDKWRVVIFDIPEEFLSARHNFRKKLKELGFVYVQKSVFVHPYRCEEEILETTKILDIEPYVQVLEAKFLSSDSVLKSQFGLL